MNEIKTRTLDNKIIKYFLGGSMYYSYYSYRYKRSYHFKD